MSATGPSTSPIVVPLYEVSVQVSGLDAEIRVNDVPVMRVPGGHVETKLDVNPHVVTGMNHLGMVVQPSAELGHYPTGARAEITLRVLPVAGQPMAETTVPQGGTLIFEPSALTPPEPPEPPAADPSTSAIEPGPADPPPLEPEPGPTAEDWERAFASSHTPLDTDPVIQSADLRAIARIPINLLTPFEPWSWLGADMLPDDQETFDQVMGETFRLWGLIKTKKIADLEALAKPQGHDWMTAYALATEAEAQQMLGIARTLGDPEVKPEPFPDPKDLKLQIVGFGKLAHLIDEEGKGPIRLGVKGMPHMKGRFTALFCRRDEGWMMIR